MDWVCSSDETSNECNMCKVMTEERKPSGSVCATGFNVLELYSAHAVYLRVAYGSHNKQQLFP
jgi:hypothetical protein